MNSNAPIFWPDFKIKMLLTLVYFFTLTLQQVSSECIITKNPVQYQKTLLTSTDTLDVSNMFSFVGQCDPINFTYKIDSPEISPAVQVSPNNGIITITDSQQPPAAIPCYKFTITRSVSINGQEASACFVVKVDLTGGEIACTAPSERIRYCPC